MTTVDAHVMDVQVMEHAFTLLRSGRRLIFSYAIRVTPAHRWG